MNSKSIRSLVKDKSTDELIQAGTVSRRRVTTTLTTGGTACKTEVSYLNPADDLVYYTVRYYLRGKRISAIEYHRVINPTE